MLVISKKQLYPNQTIKKAMTIKTSDVKKAVEHHLHLPKAKIHLLGSGRSNTNFVVNNKYVVRINAHLEEKDKINKEFVVLKALDGYNIAPKVFVKDTSKKLIPQDFLIIEYFDGTDLKNKRLSVKMIRDLAQLTATLHSISDTKLSKVKPSYQEVKVNIERLIKRTAKHGGKSDSKFLFQNLIHLSTTGPQNKLAVVHGDICDSNLVYDQQSQLRFIDFESCGLSDPAYDIADIFTGFGKTFSEKHQELFYEEYFQHRKDPTLKRRVEVFIPLKLFETLCWAVMHVYEIQQGIVSKEIQKTHPLHEHIDYANLFLNKCKKTGIISQSTYKLFSHN